MNILAVGAHPDDFEFGCFGSLLLHYKRGDKIFGLTLSKGSRGGNESDRENESIQSAKMIDMNLSFGDFEDGKIMNDVDVISFIEDYVNANDIDVIYTPSINDRHQDHRNVGLSVLVAGRKANEIYAFETISCTNDFHPTMFVNVTSTMSQKNTAISEHKSQMHRVYMNNVDIVNKYRAFKVGKSDDFFESFEVVKRVI